jgi:hypothetical protein
MFFSSEMTCLHLLKFLTDCQTQWDNVAGRALARGLCFLELHMPLSFTKDRREGLAKTLDNLAVAAYVAGASSLAGFLPQSTLLNWFPLFGLGAVFNFLAFVLRYEVVEPNKPTPEQAHEQKR